MSVRFTTIIALFPRNEVIASKTPSGTPIRSATRELDILIRSVTPIISRSSSLPEKISFIA